ncbi:MAG: carboxypeptidase regulatory-like domain-containing protein, partial [Micromonosporaceae bacterium]
TAQAEILAGQTTVQDFALQPVDSVTISGTVTDGSGHGWPLYARIQVTGTPVQTFTDPATGQYSLTLPAGDTFDLVFSAEYPGYADTTVTVDTSGSDQTVDVTLTVELNRCREAPGYELQQPRMAMVTSDPGSQFRNYFAERGIAVDFFTATQIAGITGYDLVLWGYNATSVTEANFLQFLANTDADGAGVVFLDHAFANWNGIKTLSTFTGQPASVPTDTGGVGLQNLYEVTQEHPILAGFEVGDQIIHEPNQTAAWLAWFTTYEGEGRQVIATVGRSDGTIFGNGIGVQERPTNRHVLLAIHSSSATRGPADWSPESDQIFWNALAWAAPESGSFGCVPVDGGLVVGEVSDLNTGAGVSGALVSSVVDPDVSAMSSATPDDPSLGDGFFWLFSPLTGAQEFTASAGNYQSETRTVEVVSDAATRADFALGAGLLVVEPGEVSAQLRLGQSGSRSFTVTNEGTAPVSVTLGEAGGGFEMAGSQASGVRLPSVSTPVASVDGGAVAATGGSGLAFDAASGARERSGVVARPVLPEVAQDEVTITHSASMEVAVNNSVACSPDFGFTTTENSYLRTFVLSDFGLNGGFTVSSVTFGVEASSPAQPLTVNLYTLEGEFRYANLTPIGSAEITLQPTELDLVTVPVEGVAPAGSTLVVEIDSPDMSGTGRLFIGSNSAGQTAPSYLASESCGLLEPTDTAELGFPDMHIVMSVTGTPGGGDVPWLSVAPQELVLDPGESATVTVELDAQVEQPGTYTAQVTFGHDTPYQVDAVDVSMVVTPPNNWGKLSGTITGTTCDGTTTPIAGAVVNLDGRHSDVAVLTDQDGRYGYWMPSNNGPVQVVVSADGYIPQATRVNLRSGEETVTDFHLTPVC